MAFSLFLWKNFRTLSKKLDQAWWTPSYRLLLLGLLLLWFGGLAIASYWLRPTFLPKACVYDILAGAAPGSPESKAVSNKFEKPPTSLFPQFEAATAETFVLFVILPMLFVYAIFMAKLPFEHALSLTSNLFVTEEMNKMREILQSLGVRVHLWNFLTMGLIMASLALVHVGGSVAFFVFSTTGSSGWNAELVVSALSAALAFGLTAVLFPLVLTQFFQSKPRNARTIVRVFFPNFPVFAMLLSVYLLTLHSGQAQRWYSLKHMVARWSGERPLLPVTTLQRLMGIVNDKQQSKPVSNPLTNPELVEIKQQLKNLPKAPAPGAPNENELPNWMFKMDMVVAIEALGKAEVTNVRADLVTWVDGFLVFGPPPVAQPGEGYFARMGINQNSFEGLQVLRSVIGMLQGVVPGTSGDATSFPDVASADDLVSTNMRLLHTALVAGVPFLAPLRIFVTLMVRGFAKLLDGRGYSGVKDFVGIDPANYRGKLPEIEFVQGPPNPGIGAWPPFLQGTLRFRDNGVFSDRSDEDSVADMIDVLGCWLHLLVLGLCMGAMVFVQRFRERGVAGTVAAATGLANKEAGEGEEMGLSVEHLTKKFAGGAVVANNDVSFSVRKGEIFGLLGQNGAGKTTLFRQIVGAVPVSDGDIKIRGHSVRDNPLAARKHLGYCPQDSPFFEDFTLREFLTFIAGVIGESAESVPYIAQLVGLEAKLDHPCVRMSGGQKRRAWLACALLRTSATTLLLDEPTTGLDPATRHELWGLLRYLSEVEGKTVIFTTHYLDEADILSERKIILAEGRAMCQGTSQELKREFGKGYWLRLVQNKDSESDAGWSKIEEQFLVEELGPTPEWKSDPIAAQEDQQRTRLYCVGWDKIQALPSILEKIEKDAENVGLETVRVQMTSLSDVFETVGEIAMEKFQDPAKLKEQKLQAEKDRQISLLPLRDRSKTIGWFPSLFALFGARMTNYFKRPSPIELLGYFSVLVPMFFGLRSAVTAGTGGDGMSINVALIPFFICGNIAQKNQEERQSGMFRSTLVHGMRKTAYILIDLLWFLWLYTPLLTFALYCYDAYTIGNKLARDNGEPEGSFFPVTWNNLGNAFKPYEGRTIIASTPEEGQKLLDAEQYPEHKLFLSFILLVLTVVQWICAGSVVAVLGGAILGPLYYVVVSITVGTVSRLAIHYFQNGGFSEWAELVFKTKLVDQKDFMGAWSEFRRPEKRLGPNFMFVNASYPAFGNFTDDVKILALWQLSLSVVLHVLVRWLVGLRAGGKGKDDAKLPRGENTHIFPDPDVALEKQIVDQKQAQIKQIEAGSGKGVGESVEMVAGPALVHRTSKAFKAGGGENRVWPTKDVSLALKSGEILGLLGPNGAGKSTLFNLLTAEPDCGPPNEGEVRIFGKNVHQTYSFQNVGYAAQTDVILPSLTGREQLRYFCRVSGMYYSTGLGAIPTQDYGEERINRFLREVGLTDAADRLADSYSGGMKRRLSLACTLITDPALVFLDEACAGVDIVSAKQVWKKLQNRPHGQTLITTTHSMEEAAATCNRIAILVGGSLACLGTQAGIKGKYGAGYELDLVLTHGAPGGAGMSRAATQLSKAPTKVEAPGSGAVAPGSEASVVAVEDENDDGATSDAELLGPTRLSEAMTRLASVEAVRVNYQAPPESQAELIRLVQESLPCFTTVVSVQQLGPSKTKLKLKLGTETSATEMALKRWEGAAEPNAPQPWTAAGEPGSSAEAKFSLASVFLWCLRDPLEMVSDYALREPSLEDVFLRFATAQQRIEMAKRR